MTKFIRTRHGHVEGIDPERFRGRTELPLPELGPCAGQSRRRPDRPVLAAQPYGPLCDDRAPHCLSCKIESQVLDGLNDLNYGAWQWKSYDEIRRADPGFFDACFATPHLVRFPRGDSLQDLVVQTLGQPTR